jgi:hypothetical protein
MGDWSVKLAANLIDKDRILFQETHDSFAYVILARVCVLGP